MSVIKFGKKPTESDLELENANHEFVSQQSEIESILDMAKNARDRAKELDLNFEAYLLHTSVLALCDRLDKQDSCEESDL